MLHSVHSEFSKIFNVKGNIAPLSEKAERNYILKEKSANATERLHYFAIGHAFKNIDKKTLFDLKYNEAKDTFEAQRFTSIYRPSDTGVVEKELKTLIDNIRNLYSHYVHDFSQLKTSVYKEQLSTYIEECFEVAVILTYCNSDDKKLNLEKYYAKDRDREFVNFLKSLFFPASKNKANLTEAEIKKKADYEKQASTFGTLSKKKAIRAILYIENENDFEWTLDEDHKIFTIEKDRYYSLYAHIFVLSLFLYKDEAEKLISKIRGFKQNDTTEYKEKRNLFSVFSKKFGSQDVHSEEQNLIKFRDIIHYLNHYPTIWNSELENESEWGTQLKEKSIQMEIDRIFPKYKGDENFSLWVKNMFWSQKELGKEFKKKYSKADFKNSEIEKFTYEIEKSPQFKKAKLELDAAKDVQKNNKKPRNIHKIQEEIKESENSPNKPVEALKKRISENLFYTSYGRNQDRFMEFACRFLAEKEYFGANTKFKLYRYYTTDEQNRVLERLQRLSAKKTFDQLKYHQGKLVYFNTLHRHLAAYPSWDTPFVIENNAIQLILEDGRYLSVQRALLPYFLEHALYEGSPFENGKELLESYLHTLVDEKTIARDLLSMQSSLDSDEKTKLKKILPRRLLNTYCPTPKQEKGTDSLRLFLDKTIEAENRYTFLLKQKELLQQKLRNEKPREASTINVVEDFLKKNKGKNFKLRFLKKAWHRMYFKDIYLRRKQEAKQWDKTPKEKEQERGHHKSLHITKNEYTDFCRYLFGFDELPQYKKKLASLLENKGFMQNKDFANLFKNAKSLQAMYEETKKQYEKWLQTQTKKNVLSSLDSYQHIVSPQKHILYINLPHFIGYMGKDWLHKQRMNKGEEIFRSLENKAFLIGDYYLQNHPSIHACIAKSTTGCMVSQTEKRKKSQAKKLFNSLHTAYLEDCLLYEVANHYLGKDTDITKQSKRSVNDILTQDTLFDIQDKNKKFLYTLSIPFNKLDSLVSLIRHKEEQEQNKKFKGSSFLTNLVPYVNKIKEKETDEKKKTIVGYDELNRINGEVINDSMLFTKVTMSLERYFVCKNKCRIPPNTENSTENRINCDDILLYNNKTITLCSKDGYFMPTDRKKAFHFGVSSKENYVEKIKGIEKKFITEEVKPLHIQRYSELPKLQKAVCDVLMKAIHNPFFNNVEKDKTEKIESACKRYFDEIIKK